MCSKYSFWSKKGPLVIAFTTLYVSLNKIVKVSRERERVYVKAIPL